MLLPSLLALLLSKLVALISSGLLSAFSLIFGRRIPSYETPSEMENYDMTIEEYQSMLDRQNGLCASCNNPETAKGNTGKLKPLAVDHDHVTGKVRSLLCSNCNQTLGCLEEDPERVNALLRYI